MTAADVALPSSSRISTPPATARTERLSNRSFDRLARPRSSSFAELALALSDQCRRLGLQTPFFRSPPRSGLQRSIRRGDDGSVTVAVAVRDRDVLAIGADLVDGIIAANRLSGAAADEARAALRAALRPRSAPVVASAA